MNGRCLIWMRRRNYHPHKVIQLGIFCSCSLVPYSQSLLVKQIHFCLKVSCSKQRAKVVANTEGKMKVNESFSYQKVLLLSKRWRHEIFAKIFRSERIKKLLREREKSSALQAQQSLHPDTIELVILKGMTLASVVFVQSDERQKSFVFVRERIRNNFSFDVFGLPFLFAFQFVSQLGTTRTFGTRWTIIQKKNSQKIENILKLLLKQKLRFDYQWHEKAIYSLIKRKKIKTCDKTFNLPEKCVKLTVSKSWLKLSR